MARRKRNCVIIDIDGTVALRPTTEGTRGPFDWHRVSEDIPNEIVIDTLKALENRWLGVDWIVMTGRPDECEEDTKKWLDHYQVPCDELYMRRDVQNNETNADFKSWVYEQNIKPYYNVLVVFEDNNFVTHMWRYRHGLNVFQVGDSEH